MSKHFESLKAGLQEILKDERNIPAISLLFHIPPIGFNLKKINEKLVKLQAKDADELCSIVNRFEFDSSEALVEICGMQMHGDNKLYMYTMGVLNKTSYKKISLFYYCGKFTFCRLSGTPADFIKVIEYIKPLMNFV